MLFDSYCAKKLDGDMLTLTYQKIDKYQRKDNELVDKLKHANYHTKYFRGGRIVTQLICKGNVIVMPEILRNYV